MTCARAACGYLVMLLAGCGVEYGGLVIEVDGVAMTGDTVDSSSIQLVNGHALRVHARPRSLSGETYNDSERVVLRPFDPDHLRTFRDPQPWRWVLIARAPGDSCLEVVIDGTVEECIPATVREAAR